MKSFKNKVAVVTGAASGIGLAIAKEAATLGMRVAIVDIEAGSLSAVQEELEGLGADSVLSVACDVSDAC